jgi:hypothetical protein
MILHVEGRSRRASSKLGATLSSGKAPDRPTKRSPHRDAGQTNRRITSAECPQEKFAYLPKRLRFRNLICRMGVCTKHGGTAYQGHAAQGEAACRGPRASIGPTRLSAVTPRQIHPACSSVDSFTPTNLTL